MSRLPGEKVILFFFKILPFANLDIKSLQQLTITASSLRFGQLNRMVSRVPGEKDNRQVNG